MNNPIRPKAKWFAKNFSLTVNDSLEIANKMNTKTN